MDINLGVTVFLILGILIVLGIPLAFTLGISTMIGMFFINPTLVANLPQQVYNGLNSFTFLSVPLFLLSGKIMARSGIAMRLMNFAGSIVGFMRGGLAHVNILTSMFFGGMSGSATADCASIGPILIPEMARKGYPAEFAAAVTSSSSSLGIIIPPSVPMIFFGMTAGVSVSKLFIAGIIPGILIGLSQMLVAYLLSRKNNYPVENTFSLKQVKISFIHAWPCLTIPILIVGGIYSGIFTPTEASGVAVLATFILAYFVYKSIKMQDLPGLMFEACLGTGVVALLVGTAKTYSWIVGYLHIPRTIGMYVDSFGLPPMILFFMVTIIFIIAGCFLVTTPTIFLLVPVFFPILVAAGMDPIQIGIVVTICIGIGQQTPPVGTAIIMCTQISNRPFEKVVNANLPFILIMVIMLFLFVYIPELSLILIK